jgi:hypothetical protein
MKTLTLPPRITKQQLDEVLPQHSDYHHDLQLCVTSSSDIIHFGYRDQKGWDMRGKGQTLVVTREPHDSTPGRFTGMVCNTPVVTNLDFHVRTVLDHFYSDWCKDG